MKINIFGFLFFLLLATLPVDTSAKTDTYICSLGTCRWDSKVVSFLCIENNCTHYFSTNIQYFSDGSVKNIRVGEIKQVASNEEEVNYSEPESFRYNQQTIDSIIGQETKITSGIYRYIAPNSGYASAKKISDIATIGQFAQERELFLNYTTENFPKRIDGIVISGITDGGHLTFHISILVLLLIATIYRGGKIGFRLFQIRIYNFTAFVSSLLALLLFATNSFYGSDTLSILLSYIREFLGEDFPWGVLFTALYILLAIILIYKSYRTYKEDQIVPTIYRFPKIIPILTISTIITTTILIARWMIAMSGY